MEDLLAKHAEGVTKSNAAHYARAEAIVAEADEKVHEAINAMGAQLIEMANQMRQAHQILGETMRAAINEAQEALVIAYNENLIAIAASANSMSAEFEQRLRFMTTGELPTRIEAHDKPGGGEAAQPPSQPPEPPLGGESGATAAACEALRKSIENVAAMKRSEQQTEPLKETFEASGITVSASPPGVVGSEPLDVQF
jgi:hypothetical protein